MLQQAAGNALAVQFKFRVCSFALNGQEWSRNGQKYPLFSLVVLGLLVFLIPNPCAAGSIPARGTNEFKGL